MMLSLKLWLWCSSWTAVLHRLGKRKTIEEALKVQTNCCRRTGSLPNKSTLFNIAEEAIHAALWDYAEKKNIKIEGLKAKVRYS